MSEQEYRPASFVTEPVIEILACQKLEQRGLLTMLDWVKSRAPQCVPDEIDDDTPPEERILALFPHDIIENGRVLTDNELLVELMGRKCYNSFGLKAGRKTNKEYIAHMQSGDVPHASVLYHAKMTFFIAGVSRRVSHELIRNYVGADRDEEGSPSQESTRYVEHAGFYVIPPRYLDGPGEGSFRKACRENYIQYQRAVHDDIRNFEIESGNRPKGMDYKRILEASSSLLMHTVETSFGWTTNPMAIAKLMRERDNDAADLEFRRFAKKWKKLCVEYFPNLFPQPWMQE